MIDALEYFSYDANTNLIAFQATDGNTTYYSYDPLNRKIQVLYPNEVFHYYEYDAVSQSMQVIAQLKFLIACPMTIHLHTLNTTDWNYDLVGNRIYQKQGIFEGMNYIEESYYTYDSINALT